MTLAPPTATRLEKAAVDNGFDQDGSRVGDWLAFSSTHAPLGIWLSADHTGAPVVAFSRSDVAHALNDHGIPFAGSLPVGATSARAVDTVAELHRLLRRAYQLARTLPNELLHVFQQKTAGLPRTTEAERLVVQRVGQDIFRDGLLDYWEGRCAITGLAVPELLRASHIKPWAACETDAERLLVFNGLLLSANLDAAFDRGFITVADDGQVVVSAALSDPDRRLLGLDKQLYVKAITDSHRCRLQWHRAHIFKS